MRLVRLKSVQSTNVMAKTCSNKDAKQAQYYFEKTIIFRLSTVNRGIVMTIYSDHMDKNGLR